MRCSQLGYNGVIDLKSFGENIVVNGWSGAENGVGNDDDARVLAVEKRHGNGVTLSNILLEVNQAEREYEDVALLQHFRNQPVLRAGRHKPHQHAAIQHRQDLGGAWVPMRRHHPPRGVVHPDGRDAEGVEARNLEDGRPVHENA